MKKSQTKNTISNFENKKELDSSAPDIIIYTDGSYSPNPGKGGWAAVMMHPQSGSKKEISGGFLETTIGRMELIAVVNALKSLVKDNLSVVIYSDAKYVVDSVTKKWVYTWEANHFEDRKNRDLWFEMLQQIRRQKKVDFVWVKGHSGIEHNERCDVLAYEATKEKNLPLDEGYINPKPVPVPDLFQEPEEVKVKLYEPKVKSLLGYDLRDYQGHVLVKMETFLRTSKTDRGVFVLPTGAGKSIIIAELARRFPDMYFLNIATSKELVKQNYEKFISYGHEASLLSASWNKRELGRITFSTLGTLIKEVKFFKDKKVVIVADECHLSSQKHSQFDLFLKQLKNAKTVGLTATPFRLSNTLMGSSLKMLDKDRNCMYKTIEDVVQIQEMIDGKYWSPLVYETYDMDESSLVYNSSGSEYTETSVDMFFDSNDLYKKIIDSVNEQKHKRKSILVSVPSIKAAIELANLIPGSKALHSKMNSKERTQIVTDFTEEVIQIVIQVRILTIGFDFPGLDCIIMGTPSNSLVFYYQLTGRGVRIHKDKKDCLVIDFSGNSKRFGKIEDLKIVKSPSTKGWAVLGLNGTVLTGFILNLPKVTLDELDRKAELQKENVFLKKTDDLDANFTFGKYSGSKVSQVVKTDFRYVKWLLENEKFEWRGDSLKKLRESLIIHVEKVAKKLAD